MRGCLFITLLFLISCKQETVVNTVADFEYEVADNNYSIPVNIKFSNKSTAAQSFQWTFEGATPSKSDERNPGAVTYQTAGTYVVRLEAWNEDSRSQKEISIQIDSVVVVDFSLANLVNDFAPAQFSFTNLSKGCNSFSWTFEGGTPGTSAEKTPSPVTFTEGEHTITLSAGNGRKNLSVTKSITVRPPLQAAFVIEPNLEDNDYEAPVVATLVNHTISGLSWKWTTTGGAISNDTTRSPKIHFATPGTYTVTLTANNDKDIKVVTQDIVVKTNRNLRTFADVKLGINTAHKTVGCYFSSRLQRVLTADDDLSESGKYIDIVFFGLNATFWKNQFISPDSVHLFTFLPIPSAQACKLVNLQELSGYNFTVADFDGMVNDTPLQSLTINATRDGVKPFGDAVPRIVLIRTDDGRKGAIKVKQMVADGLNSYIICDIKIQKEP